jgi:hypothetical protein
MKPYLLPNNRPFSLAREAAHFFLTARSVLEVGGEKNSIDLSPGYHVCDIFICGVCWMYDTIPMLSIVIALSLPHL